VLGDPKWVLEHSRGVFLGISGPQSIRKSWSSSTESYYRK